jgi:adenylate kinase
MRNLILFGPPGAGKGTQSAFLVDHYNLVHLSTGDIFRANIKGETELGTLAKSYMDQGQLVPDDVTIRMLESEVDKHPEAAGFIFDGFPRTLAQADALEALLNESGNSLDRVVSLDVDDEVLVQRVVNRAKEAVAAGKEARADDNAESMRTRLAEYYKKTSPLLGYYYAKGNLKSIDGLAPIEQVQASLAAALDA